MTIDPHNASWILIKIEFGLCDQDREKIIKM